MAGDRNGPKDKMELMKAAAILTQTLQAHQETLTAMPKMEPQVQAAADMLIDSLQNGGQVLVCGNGGSSSDAQHLVGELVGRFLTERRPLPAIALGGSEAALTAIANDYSYEQGYSRQVRAYARPGDIFIGITTSGNSGNIVAAAEAAKAAGAKVIGMTGEGGGKMKELSDVLLNVPSKQTPRIQEMHILLIHVLCEAVDNAFPIED
jgi:D-sedoheptulose 7-phosphate isomerase